MIGTAPVLARKREPDENELSPRPVVGSETASEAVGRNCTNERLQKFSSSFIRGRERRAGSPRRCPGPSHATSRKSPSPRSRTGFLGYMRSLLEARRKRPSVIAPGKHDVSSYDLVVIGTPVWAWSLSSPVRAYLMAKTNQLPAVAFFCTLGGKGSESSLCPDDVHCRQETSRRLRDYRNWKCRREGISLGFRPLRRRSRKAID